MNCSFCVKCSIVRQFVSTLAAVAVSAGLCQAAPETTLYNVDFNGPPHSLGMTPAFAEGPFPRNTPTAGGEISPTGTVEVVAAFGSAVDRPARLTAVDGDINDPTFGGSNLVFHLNDPALAGLNRFHAQVDVLATELSTSSGLGIFFDAPTIHKVEFSSDGFIRVRDATGVNMIVDTYNPEKLTTVRMTFDRLAAEWMASVNGVSVYQGPVDNTNLIEFRIAMTTGDSTTTSLAYVDNIRITAEVPEPGTVWLVGLALSGALFCRWRLAKGSLTARKCALLLDGDDRPRVCRQQDCRITRG